MRAKGFVDEAKYQGAMISQSLKVPFRIFEQDQFPNIKISKF